jgi:hypothetical protein
MKKWIFTGLMALLSWEVGAQVTFGVRAGLSYTSLTQMIEEEVTYGGRMGFCLAGLLDIPISQRFSLRPELAVLNLGGTYYVEYMVEKNPYIEIERHKSNYYSIQLPVNFTYKISSGIWQFGVYGGPFVSVSTQAREKDVLEERKFRPFDVGAGTGLYVQYRRVFTSIYVHSGFIDRQIHKRSHESQLYQNNVIFSLGYWL